MCIYISIQCCTTPRPPPTAQAQQNTEQCKASMLPLLYTGIHE
uniref:Uncharacterized protein n=1 Tax=Rhizophora mucronata TaxID=61149 RepID=A0A2P2MBT1_RHIMU